MKDIKVKCTSCQENFSDGILIKVSGCFSMECSRCIGENLEIGDQKLIFGQVEDLKIQLDSISKLIDSHKETKEQINTFFKFLKGHINQVIEKEKNRISKKLFPFYSFHCEIEASITSLKNGIEKCFSGDSINLNAPDLNDFLKEEEKFFHLKKKINSFEAKYGRNIFQPNQNYIKSQIKKLSEFIIDFANSTLQTQRKKIPQTPLPFSFNTNSTNKPKFASLSGEAVTNAMVAINTLNSYVIGDWEGYLSNFRDSDYKLIHKKKIHDGNIYCGKYSEERKLIFTSSQDKTVKITLLDQKRGFVSIKTLGKFILEPMALNYSEKLDLIIASCWGPNLYLWSLKTFLNKGLIDTVGKQYSGSEIAIIPEKNWAAVVFYNGTLGVYCLIKKQEIMAIKFSDIMMQRNSLFYIPESSSLMLIVTPNTYLRLQVKGDDLVYKHKYEFDFVALSAIDLGSGKLLINSKPLKIYDMDKKEIIEEFDFDFDASVAMGMNKQTRTIYVGGKDKRICVLNFN